MVSIVTCIQKFKENSDCQRKCDKFFVKQDRINMVRQKVDLCSACQQTSNSDKVRLLFNSVLVFFCKVH
jgi:hypothetical protein